MTVKAERALQEIDFQNVQNLFRDIYPDENTDYEVELVPGACVLLHRQGNEQLLVIARPFETGFDIMTIIPDGVRGGTQLEKTHVPTNIFATNTADQQGSITFKRA